MYKRQNIYTLNFIGIRHTAGAISQAFAAYIAVLLMRMADFAITVSRMTGNVMSVYMSMFVAVVMSAATLVTVCVSMFMLVAVVVAATAFVTVCMSVFMLMAVVVTTTAFVTMSMLGNMSHSFVIMILAAVTAGAAFRMLAVIFYAINMTVDVSESSYITGTITDIL